MTTQEGGYRRYRECRWCGNEIPSCTCGPKANKLSPPAKEPVIRRNKGGHVENCQGISNCPVCARAYKAKYWPKNIDK